MAIGSLGDVIFTVDDKNIITFQDIKYKRQIEFAEHKIHLHKPIFEFAGYKADEISLTIHLTDDACEDIQKTYDELIDMFKKHEPVYFYIGGQAVSENKWLIESINSSCDFITHDGKLLERKIDLSLKEYGIDKEHS